MESVRMSASTGDVVCAIAQAAASIILRMEVVATVDVVAAAIGDQGLDLAGGMDEIAVAAGPATGDVIVAIEIAAAAGPETGDVIVAIEIAVAAGPEGEIVIAIVAAVAAEEGDKCS